MGASLNWLFAKKVADRNWMPSVRLTSRRTPDPERLATRWVPATSARIVASSPSRSDDSGVSLPQW